MGAILRSTATDTNTSGVNEASLVITKPSQTADGDVMVAVISAPSTATITPPAGWVELETLTTTNGQHTGLFKKIAASEGASYTFTLSSSGSCSGSIASFMGARDVLHWSSRVTGTTTPATGRALDAARDCVSWQVYCHRNDTSNATVSWSFGAEHFDIGVPGATAIRRQMSGAYYGPGAIDDIVNIGDDMPSGTATPSVAPLYAHFYNVLIDDQAPDTEPWSATDGDFAVELKLDKVGVDEEGSITTTLLGDITGQVTAFTESAENAPNEITEKLTDGLASTKWLTNSATGWVQYDFGSGNPKTIKRYRMTSGNDAQERDPMNWTVQGSNNGTDFTVLDTRTNQAFGLRGDTREFNITTTGSYRYYRLDITANKSSGATALIQLAEWRLSSHAVWEDITSFVNEEGKIRVTRGLQGSSGRSDFSRAYFELNNTDGRFATRNQNGAFYGSLQRNTEVRISKAYGTKSLQLQGAVRLEGTDMCGDGVRCALTADLQAPGDLDVRVDFQPESWRDEQMLAGVSIPEGGSGAWTLHLASDGRLVFTWYDGSTTRAIESTVSVPPSTRQTVRATLDADNGASGNTVTFYTSTSTSPTNWVKLGDPVISAGVSSIEYSGGALCVGHVGSRSQRGIHGRVFEFQLRDGIDGTIVANINFTSLTNGAHSFTEGDNRWVTVDNAVISNRHFRFHGEVSEWPVSWDPTGTWIVTAATGAGIQKRMERSNNPASAMRRYHTKAVIADPGPFQRFAAPYAYWPIEDKKDSFEIASGLPNKAKMQIYGSPQFDGDDADKFHESDALPRLMGAKYGGRVSNNPSGYADIRWIHYSPTGMADSSEVMELYSTGTGARWILNYQTDNTWRLDVYTEADEAAPAQDTGSQSVTAEGEVMHIQLILDQDGADVDITMRAFDDSGVSLGSWTDTFTGITLGRVFRINVNPLGDISDTYIGHVALYGATSPAFEGTQINAHHYETAGNRIKRLCQEEQAEFRFVGSLDETQYMGYQGIDATFAQMSSAAVSDGGYLIDPLDAFGIEYRTQRSILNQAAHVTLSYSGNELSGDLTPVEDDSYLLNDFTANRGEAGGSRFQKTDGRLSVDLPPDGVGPYEDSQSYSLAHEGQCVDLASWEVHKGTLDEERYPRIELALENLRVAADAALTESILTLDVGKRLDITDTATHMPAEDVRQIIIGYEEWFDNFQHDFTLNCIPERAFEVAEYDGWKHFDAHESTLYQDVSSSATTIVTLVDEGQKWTEDVQSMPFDIRVDGEVMRVVAPGEKVNANPFFYTNTTGWSSQNGSLTWSTDYVHPHPAAVASTKVTPDGSLGSANALSDAGIAIVPQNKYKVSGWIFSPGGYDEAKVNMNWHDATNYLSTGVGTNTVIPAGVWTYLEDEFTAPAGATTGRGMLEQSNSPTAGEVFYVWAVRMTESVSAGDESWIGDSFNRADSTTSLGTTDGDGTTGPWTQLSGTWGINGNQAYISAAADSVATVGGSADIELLQMEVPTWTAGAANLVFRATNLTNYLRFGGTLGAAAILEQVVAGVVTTIATADVEFTLAAGNTLAVRAHGSVIECFVNGRLALCVTDTTQQTATACGMRISTSIATRIDNWYVESASSTQPVTVERDINGAAAAHKSGAEVKLLNTPYRGM